MASVPGDQLVEEVPALRRVFGWWLRFVLDRREAQWAFAAALFLSVCLLTALGQIDGLLGAMHPPGDAAFAMGALSDTGFPPPEPDRIADVARTWLAGSTQGFTAPTTLAGAYLGLDVLFIAAYGWLLAVSLLRLRGWLLDSATPEELQGAVARRAARGEVGADSEAAEVERIWHLTHRYVRLQAVGCAGVLVLLVVDLLEDALQALAVVNCVQAQPAGWCDGAALTWSLYVVTVLKWALFAAVLAAAILGLLALASFRRDRVRELARVLMRLRAPVVLVAALAFGYLVSASPLADQAADLLRRWEDEPHLALSAVLLTAALSAVLLTCARGLLAAQRVGTTATPLSWAGLLARSVVLLAAGWAALEPLDLGPGLLVLSAILVMLMALGSLVGSVDDDPPPSAVGTFGAKALPALLAAVPIVVLGLALQRAALGEVAWAGNDVYLLWLFVGLCLQAAGWAAYWRCHGEGATSLGLVVLGTVIVFAAAVWTWTNPWGLAEVLGGAGILAAFMIALTLLGCGLSGVAERIRPPAALRLLGFRRTPFLMLLLVWGFGAGAVDNKGEFHQTRVLSNGKVTAAPPRGVTLTETFDRWRRNRGLPPARGSPGKAPRRSAHATPLLLVAASGGGIRAAYWTAQTLDCLFGRDAENAQCRGKELTADPVLAASGVSGGSLGLTAWATHVRTPGTAGWIDTLRADALSPTLAWTLFVDLPNSLLHTARFADRAEILERSWERAWIAPRLRERGKPRNPLAEGLFASGHDPPLLLLNGTAVESGCRFNISVLNANVDQPRPKAAIEDCLSARGFEQGGGIGPDGANAAERIKAAREEWALGASVDVNRFLCDGHDLRLSTAALLSARFPYVSPSGQLDDCGEPPASTYVVDGGYFDSSAAGTAAELWTGLEPIVERYNRATGQCVVPFAIQIDNGYDEPPGPDPGKRPQESFVPLQTVLGGRDAGEADARQALALAVNKPVGDVRLVSSQRKEQRRYAHIYPRAHPGTQAPLGWALSSTTQGDLARQLTSSANTDAITRVREHWLKPGKLTCERE